jgi:hypothetical protein
MSESLATIPTYAFFGTLFSGELVIPDCVTTIGNYAFRGMTGLESVVIGAGVTQLGNSTTDSASPFYSCSGIKTVMFMGTQVPTFGTNIFGSMSKLETVYVPGHTKDSVMFYAKADHAAFVGDTIFKGSIGNYQYPGGNRMDLERSIINRIFALPEETVLYSGHSDPTTVGTERSRYF